MKCYKLSIPFVFLLTASGITRAGDIDYYREVFEIYKSQVHHRLIRRVNSHDRKILSQLELELVEEPRLVTFAGTGKREKKVYISIGFLDGIYNYVECLLLEGEIGANNICDSYFKYYFKRIVSDNPKPPWPVARLEFRDNTGILDKWASEPGLNSARKVTFFSALISVMMHEYGHHIVGFYKKNASISEMRKLEGDVDTWAYKQLDKMGEKPALGAVIALGYLSQVERYRNSIRERYKDNPWFRQPPRTHPKPSQRVLIGYNLTCEDSQNNAAIKSACSLLRRTIASYE